MNDLLTRSLFQLFYIVKVHKTMERSPVFCLAERQPAGGLSRMNFVPSFVTIQKSVLDISTFIILTAIF